MTETQFIPSTKLPGVQVVIPEQHNDWRGDYAMVYNKKLYAAHGIDADFVEHCISTSVKGVIRGIHGDFACDKLIDCKNGRIYYVLLDPDSGIWESFILTGENHIQLYKPKKYAAGLLALTEGVVFHYLQSSYYDPNRQQSWRYDDPRFGIYWPVTTPLISERDLKADSSVLRR